jgi:hypothetical protein
MLKHIDTLSAAVHNEGNAESKWARCSRILPALAFGIRKRKERLVVVVVGNQRRTFWHVSG